MKKSLFFLFAALLTVAAWAVPAKPGLTRNITLSDGRTVTARLVGDENGHYWLAQDGKAYLSIDGTERFRAINPQLIQQRAKARRAASNARRAKRLAPAKLKKAPNAQEKKKGLIILVNFKNATFQSENNNALYQRIANEVGFSEGNFQGSMRDYFFDQSEGLFELDFDVVGPVTVSKDYSYYGQNDAQGNDKHPATMVIEALKLVDSQVNFADYDWDGDGEVEQVYVVYAGKGEADGGASNTIWPHEYNLKEAKEYGDGDGLQVLDDVIINTYACGSELNGSGTIDGIGTMCHEFAHCLGYPDFYDTDYSGGQGMFTWDLMDGGSYNGDGFLPCGFTSYERWVAGWKEPVELTEDCTVTDMKALCEGGTSYVIYNPGNRNEFFLLENRQQTGWDGDVPGSGLLILHVDYDAYVWAMNQANDDPNHQRMTWIAADNEYQYEMYLGTKYFSREGAATDVFPYGKVNAFGPNTTPAAKFYNKSTDGSYLMKSAVKDIAQNANGIISFTFSKDGSVTPDPGPRPTGTDDFELVKDASTLAEGDEILIAYVEGGEALALSTTQNTNNRGAVEITLNADGTLTPGEDTQIITLEKAGAYYLFNVGEGYLYAASSTKNQLKTIATPDDNAEASITISGGDATIQFQGSNTRNYLRFNANNGSPLFACYASSSSVQTLPQIYRRIPMPTIALQNAAENAELLEENDGVTADVTLSGRTFWKDGEWNTLCLPFSLQDFTGTPLDGAIVMALNTETTVFNEATGNLTIHFSPVTKIAAGNPYVFKWAVSAGAASEATIVDPVFPAVTIDNVEPATVFTDDGFLTFTGTYDPISIGEEGDNTKLFMHTASTLYYPNGAMTISPFRAFFQLNGITAGEQADVRSMTIYFGENETTAVREMTERPTANGPYFDLSGRRVNKAQMKNGIYLQGGKKMIVH